MDNLQIPQNLTELYKLQDNTTELRKFLVDLLQRIKQLEEKVKELEDGN